MVNLKRFKLNSDKQVLIAGIVCSVVLLSFVVYVFTLPAPTQPIFPMWVVEQNGAIPSSEMNITLGNQSGLLIGVQNQMGKLQYCSIVVKFRNLSSPPPVSANATVQSKASPLHPIMSFSLVLTNNETWVTPFNFKFLWEGNIDNSYTINSVVINDQSYNLTEPIQNGNLQNSSYQFLFELWTKNTPEENYNFSGIWVSSPFLIFNQNISLTSTSTPEPTPTSMINVDFSATDSVSSIKDVL